jgi:hypothetical protein
MRAQDIKEKTQCVLVLWAVFHVVIGPREADIPAKFSVRSDLSCGLRLGYYTVV